MHPGELLQCLVDDIARGLAAGQQPQAPISELRLIARRAAEMTREDVRACEVAMLDEFWLRLHWRVADMDVVELRSIHEAIDQSFHVGAAVLN